MRYAIDETFYSCFVLFRTTSNTVVLYVATICHFCSAPKYKNYTVLIGRSVGIPLRFARTATTNNITTTSIPVLVRNLYEIKQNI
jgi:hypothetical protein